MDMLTIVAIVLFAAIIAIWMVLPGRASEVEAVHQPATVPSVPQA